MIAILIAPLSAQHTAVDFPPNDEITDPALVQVPEDRLLPRVLIMGDSISLGYTWEVRKLLAGKANVQHPDVNCWSTEFGLEHVKQWLGEKHWDVIYFNFGLHDLKYLDDKGRYVTPDKGKQVASIKQYQANLRRIVANLQSTGAKLIFATTTPVPSGTGGRVKGDEIRYNTAAIEVMREMGAEIDDLSMIGDDCQIKPGAEIINSVLGPGCFLEERARVVNSIIWPHTRLGTAATVTDAIVGRGCHIGRSAVVAAGSVLGDKTSLTDYTMTGTTQP